MYCSLHTVNIKEVIVVTIVFVCESSMKSLDILLCNLSILSITRDKVDNKERLVTYSIFMSNVHTFIRGFPT